MTVVEQELMILYMKGPLTHLSNEERTRAKNLILDTPIKDYAIVYAIAFGREPFG